MMNYDIYTGFKRDRQLLTDPATIYVAGDCVAFFTTSLKWPIKLFARKMTHNIEDIVQLDKNTQLISDHAYLQYYYPVTGKELHYFDTKGYEFEISTLSITTPCIVFSAHSVNEQGLVTDSGVYHAKIKPPNPIFYEKLNKLITTVARWSNNPIYVKAAGGGGFSSDDIIDLLDDYEVIINPDMMVLTGGSWRITQFYPQTGILRTYFEKEGAIVGMEEL